eukprot:COSAG06_NODE_1181_length_10363_cov_10.391563_8_plen_49_part_00
MFQRTLWELIVEGGGKETAVFARHVILKNHHFTKTGSGNIGRTQKTFR